MREPVVRLHDEGSAPLTTRPAFSRGDPGPISASLANVPELFEVTRPFIGRALAGVTVDRRTAELVIVLASAVLGCEYCILTHAAIALDADVSSDELRALCGDDPLVAARDGRERSLIAWVGAVAGGHGPVPSELTEAMKEWADDATIVELATMVGGTIFLNRYSTALGLPVPAATLRKLSDAGVSPSELGFTEVARR